MTGKKNVLEKNRITSPKKDGIAVANTGNELWANKIAGAGECGVRITKDSNSIEKNEASKSGDWDLLDTTWSGANWYEKNKFMTESKP